MSYYSFGVPAVAIYSMHIIVGLYFMYLGYRLTNDDIKKESKNEMNMHALILFGLGILMFFYHAHLWYLSSKGKNNHSH